MILSTLHFRRRIKGTVAGTELSFKKKQNPQNSINNPKLIEQGHFEMIQSMKGTSLCD